MQFGDIIGQQQILGQLRHEARTGRVPHARLFSGPAGTGALPAALAYARYLLCQHPAAEEPCGECPACRMTAAWAHPDLHFAFPIVNRAKTGRKSVCDDFLPDWRRQLAETPYFGLNHWLDRIGAENQQATIYTAESDEIARKLALKSSQGGYRILIIWLPEKMQEECANKLLKLLEEPPAGTLFILVSEEPGLLLDTIRSRTRHTPFPPLPASVIEEALTTRQNLSPADARQVARQAAGSWLQALETLSVSRDSALFFDMFVLLMRLAWQRKVREMRQWSEQTGGWGRERQKNFLAYCQHLLRENFMYNFGRPELISLAPPEQDFAARFARFINERNIAGIMDELTLAQCHIGQNVNPRMVFFDLALKMTVLLIPQ